MPEQPAQAVTPLHLQGIGLTDPEVVEVSMELFTGLPLEEHCAAFELLATQVMPNPGQFTGHDQWYGVAFALESSPARIRPAE